MKHNLRTTTGLVLLTAFTMTMMAPLASTASTAGRRNTAIGLTAATIWAASRGKSKTALALGAGAAYAWKRHADARKHRAYYYGYQRGSKAHRVHFVKNGRVHYYSARRGD